MTSDGEARRPSYHQLVPQRLIFQYVAWRYLKLLGSVYGMSRLRKRLFFSRLRWDGGRIADKDLALLLSAGWRESLTASFLVAASGRAAHVDQLGQLLVSSDTAIADEGYCLALARIGTASARAQLVRYLDRGPVEDDDPRFDAVSAVAALVIVDRKLGSDAAARFLQPGGLWDACTDDDQLLEHHVHFMSEVLAQLGDRQARGAASSGSRSAGPDR